MVMSIQEILIKFKHIASSNDIHTVMILISIAFSSFMLGKYSVVTPNDISTINHEVVNSAGIRQVVEQTPGHDVASNTELTNKIEGGYVASKSGTKYHLPWCSGAQRIKEENKVWFSTKESAEAAGYAPAANCPGI
jgi:hypothetical protein